MAENYNPMDEGRTRDEQEVEVGVFSGHLVENVVRYERE